MMGRTQINIKRAEVEGEITLANLSNTLQKQQEPTHTHNVLFYECHDITG